MTSVRLHQLFGTIPAILLFFSLAACTGMGGSGSGPAAPGGAVGSAGTGGALDTGPVALGSQNQAAGGGILSAPADDETLGNCDIWTFLYYGKDFEQQFNSAEDKVWPLTPGSSFSETFLLRSLSNHPVELQVRIFQSSADGSTVRYKDYRVDNPGMTGAPLKIEIDGVASGDQVQILVPYGLKTVLEGSETCIYRSDKNFKPDWTASNSEELKQNLGNRVRIASLKLQLIFEGLPVGKPDLVHPALDSLSE